MAPPVSLSPISRAGEDDQSSSRNNSTAERLLFALLAFVVFLSVLFLIRLLIRHIRRRRRFRMQAAPLMLPPFRPLTHYAFPAPPRCVGATRHAVDAACPAETLSKPPADATCPVCLDALQPGSLVRRLRCSHVFHDDCAVDWLVKMNVCPVCRTPPVDDARDRYPFDVYGEGDVSAHSGLRALSDRAAAHDAATAAGFVSLAPWNARGWPTT